MAGQQRLITDVFAQHKEISRASKAKPSTPTTHAPTEDKKDVNVEALKQKIRNKEIDVLKQFDLCWKYGPCIGITRLERWERAQKHDMSPPEEVRKIILKYEDQEDYTQSIWHDYPL